MVFCAHCGAENREGARFCDSCAAALTVPTAVREQRKTVTVLFCDVTGSTDLGERLDPEALRSLLARYFERMKATVERHGGTVEKFIGDAVMAVFGVPVLHEDDALRALRAAAEMRDALPELGVQGRIGVATGEVVTGTEERVASERSCQLFTILGPAGVGKSRLAAEFFVSIGDPLVVRGRCLPYGEGITYWPVVEIVKQLPAAEPDPAAAEAIRTLLGEQQLVTSSEEIAWGFRKQLEAVASERPLVCVFDDLHWGEETLLDLVEHVADLSRDAPILLLCMARPDLLDRRTGWGGGKVNATSVLLEPLTSEETELLIDNLARLDEGLRSRIREAAEGNPLFVEEMVALVQESGDGEVTVPPTIQALMAARLDQLEGDERNVLQCGSVEGRVFHRGAVQELNPGEARLPARLTALVRKELIRPDKAELPGEDAFRFRHLLIRDAAYDALPKTTRAELHERYSGWLEKHGADLVELDEMLGYHLEQAHRCRRELGQPSGGLGERAAAKLAAAGRRALDRGDMDGASNLLARAAALLEEADKARLELEVDLGEALLESGRLPEAESLLEETVARAAHTGDEL